ncbi:lipid IV(A) 3-deoxy-D-manno-octulosonic acid transferase [Ferrimonas gelatinilytica]|uniref:3-deoxy-D-manno-octulosonic acid transferase n=1 Tax=Ferrimonas gelatinilytica TaxID=1255257 RepID=A0ABP9SAD1_9GAMM
MNRFVYSLLLTLLLPLVLLYLLWRSRKEPGYRQRLTERFGLTRPARSGGILVHCASVGETLAAMPLIRALQARYPQKTLTVTSTTPTGSAQVRKQLGDSVQHCYLPLDLPGPCKRFLRALQPELVILVETELWPNLIHVSKRQGSKVMVTNARLSARSAEGYQRWPRLVRPMLSELDAVAMQNEIDAERMVSLGLDPAKLRVCGSLKFDLQIPADAEQQLAAQRHDYLGERSVWCAGSTHPGEFEQALDAHRQLLTTHPDLLLILVPRHPEQFDHAFELSQQAGFKVVRRSDQGQVDQSVQVLIGDTMGELLTLYGFSDACLVGGSLIPRGGHNPLEPAALSKPVIMGTHYFNFAEIGDSLRQADAMLVVNNGDELAQQLEQLLSLRSEARAMGKRGLRVVEINRGATQRQQAVAEQLLGAA